MLIYKKIRNAPPEAGAEMALRSKLCVVGEYKSETLHGCSEVYGLTRLLARLDSKNTFNCKGKYSFADFLQYFWISVKKGQHKNINR